MKRERWITFSLSSVLTFLLCFACALCLVSAFSMHRHADLMQIALWCAVISIIASLLPTLHVGWIMPFFLAALGTLLWKYGELEESLKSLLHTISVYCQKGYGSQILRWEDVDPLKTDRTLALQAISSMVAMFTGWCICEKQSCAWAIFGALIAFAPCTLVLFSVPDEKYLFLWLLPILLLLLTQGTRRQNEREGNRLTIWLLLPTVLAMLLLFYLFPSDEYDQRERAERILASIEAYFDADGSAEAAAELSSVVDLENIRNPSQTDRIVMRASATQAGTYYLRGRAYDSYTGLHWEDSGRNNSLPWQPLGEYRATIVVKTNNVEPILYLPYFSEQMVLNTDAFVSNGGGEKQYTAECYDDALNGILYANSQEIAYYTQLPESTMQWASQLLLKTFEHREGIKPEEIADFVRNHAEYDLATGKMSDDYDDLAQWFLEKSDTGYCVHFATATTVLLRATGIPARYVTGYTFRANDNQDVKIYTTDAHAWVEYWTQNMGWQILDPTPSDAEAVGPNTPTQESTQESVTEGSETESTSQPTETEDNEKTEPTQSVSDDITKPTESTSFQNEALSDGPAQQRKTEDTVISAPVKYALIFFAIIILLSIIVILQWYLRVRSMLRSLQKKTNNERAIACWNLILRYSQVLDQTPDTSLYKLVSKAKFSQHSLTKEELFEFEHTVDRCLQKLRNRAWYRQLYDRIILALY